MKFFINECDGVFAARCLLKVGVGRGPDLRCFKNTSSSESNPEQITFGAAERRAAQIKGNSNRVNTGTVTTLTTTNSNSNNPETNSRNNIGAGAQVTYNTGLSAADLAALLGANNTSVDAATGTVSGGGVGGGGVTVFNPAANATDGATWPSYLKWALPALALLGLGWLFWRRKKA